MEPIIEFSHYSFRYRSQKEPTLTDINLKIYPGEKILITGPSGCGKSTLVIPCSFAGETQGTLRVGGLDPKEAGVFGMSKVVGTVLQDTDGQFIGLTVAEDLAFALENDAVAQDEMFRKVDRVADIVDMKNFLRHSPSELSGGQKQRVSLGGVLVDDVKVLLFDEPLANLDPATGKHTIALIDDIRKSQNVTVVIIEHRVEDVLYKDVDRIIVMSEGRIAADMRPDELLCTDILPSRTRRSSAAYRDDACGSLYAAGAKLVPRGSPACPGKYKSGGTRASRYQFFLSAGRACAERYLVYDPPGRNGQHCRQKRRRQIHNRLADLRFSQAGPRRDSSERAGHFPSFH